MNSIAILIYALSGFLAALSQLLLKFAALRPNGRKGVLQFLDVRILGGYAILSLTIVLNMIAMWYIPYKFVPVLSALSYVFVLALGRYVLSEPIGRRKIVGIVLIFLGIFVSYFGI